MRVPPPYAASGPTDIIARLMGPWLAGRLGQQFIIENRPGAAGNVGTEVVVCAENLVLLIWRRNRITSWDNDFAAMLPSQAVGLSVQVNKSA